VGGQGCLHPRLAIDFDHVERALDRTLPNGSLNPNTNTIIDNGRQHRDTVWMDISQRGKPMIAIHHGRRFHHIHAFHAITNTLLSKPSDTTHDSHFTTRMSTSRHPEEIQDTRQCRRSLALTIRELEVGSARVGYRIGIPSNEGYSMDLSSPELLHKEWHATLDRPSLMHCQFDVRTSG
jgi:hypothetical protein